MPKGRTVVATSRHGPIRMAIEASGDMLALFTVKARNDLVRDAMWQGGEYWRTKFLPLRFTDYAKRLGYRAAPSTMKAKLRSGRVLPLVWKGDLRDMAIDTSSTTARATRSKTEAIIRIPGPPYMNQQPMVYKTLRSVPDWEIKRVGEVVREALAENLSATTPTVRSDNKLQKLTAAQSQTLTRSKRPSSRAAPGARPRKGV